MIDVFLLAIGLSMDALAVSLSLGAGQRGPRFRLAILAAIYFGVSQGAMPLIGFYIGRSVLGGFADYTNLIAFVILLLIGLKMIYEAFQESETQEVGRLSHRLLAGLAIATSIDALAAGFSLSLFSVPAVIVCVIITLVTAVFSFVGVYLGAVSGEKYESKAEFFGGVVLIGIGIKLLVG